MKCFRPVIPIKKYRCDLKVDQRVKILQFRRGMSPTQVKNVIQRGFSHLGCSSFLYLETFSNSLRVCNNNNNNTQKAALAKLPLTTHPHERAEPHTLQTQFTPACTTWPSPLPCETPDLPDLPTLPPTPATGPRSPAED